MRVAECEAGAPATSGGPPLHTALCCSRVSIRFFRPGGQPWQAASHSDGARWGPSPGDPAAGLSKRNMVAQLGRSPPNGVPGLRKPFGGRNCPCIESGLLPLSVPEDGMIRVVRRAPMPAVGRGLTALELGLSVTKLNSPLESPSSFSSSPATALTGCPCRCDRGWAVVKGLVESQRCPPKVWAKGIPR